MQRNRTLFYILIILIFITVMCDLRSQRHFTHSQGAIIRGDSTRQEIALVFTGGDFSDGGKHIRDVLRREEVTAGFFFTGDFYRNEKNRDLIENLLSDDHYLGPHSDQHLLYCSWADRDSLLVSREEFINDMDANYREMEKFGISEKRAPYFIPPYEWYNASIVRWAEESGWTLFNYTPGTLSHADYTTPGMKAYRSSATILRSILDYEENNANGLNGFVLLVHIGSHPDRKDKFYLMLKPLIAELKNRGYQFIRIDHMIGR